METYHGNTVEYWKQNAEEDYITTPISVLKYITILEEQAEQLRKNDVSGSDIDYKKLYHELYENVANMLVENRQHNWTPHTLLHKWDSFRK